jgi:hypothetical protein
VTKDEIDTMWQKAMQESIKDGEMYTRYHFANLVAAKEREACAKLCDSFYESWINIHGRYEFMGEGAQECAEAIRARGQA